MYIYVFFTSIKTDILFKALDKSLACCKGCPAHIVRPDEAAKREWAAEGEVLDGWPKLHGIVRRPLLLNLLKLHYCLDWPPFWQLELGERQAPRQRCWLTSLELPLNWLGQLGRLVRLLNLSLLRLPLRRQKRLLKLRRCASSGDSWGLHCCRIFVRKIHRQPSNCRRRARLEVQQRLLMLAEDALDSTNSWMGAGAVPSRMMHVQLPLDMSHLCTWDWCKDQRVLWELRRKVGILVAALAGKLTDTSWAVKKLLRSLQPMTARPLMLMR